MTKSFCYNRFVLYQSFKYFSTNKETKFFCSETKSPFFREDLKISFRGGKIESPHSFSICLLIIPCTWALYFDQVSFTLTILALVTGIDENVLVVFILSAAEISHAQLTLTARVHPIFSNA